MYIEEASNISKEFYLSCLIDRDTSKIAFISSTEGGMDIEKVASETLNKIKTIKIDFKKEGPSKNEINNIISIFELNDQQKKDFSKIIKSLYKIIVEKDASLIEINPLVVTEEKKLVCLDAKMTFDDNSIFEDQKSLSLEILMKKTPQKLRQANMILLI